MGRRKKKWGSLRSKVIGKVLVVRLGVWIRSIILLCFIASGLYVIYLLLKIKLIIMVYE